MPGYMECYISNGVGVLKSSVGMGECQWVSDTRQC